MGARRLVEFAHTLLRARDWQDRPELERRRGVDGTDTALEAIAEACGHHALTVDLIGGYLAAFKGGAPLLEGLPSHEEIARIAAEEPDRKRQAVARQSARFSRIAQRYREGLREHDPLALALMQRICLFRMGVTVEMLAAIFLGEESADRRSSRCRTAEPGAQGCLRWYPHRTSRWIQLPSPRTPAPACADPAMAR